MKNKFKREREREREGERERNNFFFFCGNWESYAQNVRELQIYIKVIRIRRYKNKER